MHIVGYADRFSVRQGEYRHSTTGELGGLWRYRGKTPQRIVGVGMSAVGGEPARPYRRRAASRDPRVAFLFEGIGEREILGDFGLQLGGAVFPVGSISYCASLSHHRYDNNISRLTDNVLRAFAADALPAL